MMVPKKMRCVFAHPDKDWKLIKEVAKLKPIGIGHHGNRTDERFRNREMDVVHDFVKAVQDAGIPCGVSMHNPARMTAMVRKTSKPCFAFKILAAGGTISRPE